MVMKEILVYQISTDLLILPIHWKDSRNDDQPYLASSLSLATKFVESASLISSHVNDLASFEYFSHQQIMFIDQDWTKYAALFKRDLPERKLIRRVVLTVEPVPSEFVVYLIAHLKSVD